MASQPPSSHAGASSSATSVETEAPQASDYLTSSLDASGSLESLCELCRDLFSGSKTLSADIFGHYKYPHHSIPNLFDSKQDSCRVCQLLRRASMSSSECLELHVAERYPPESQKCRVEFTEPDEDDKSGAQYYVRFWYYTDSLQKMGLLINLLIPENSLSFNSSSPGLTNGLLQETSNVHILSSNTGSEASLGIGMRWLKDCTENHDTCKKTPMGERRLPTRLVEINDDWVSLRTSEDLPLNTKYCTLSHCWGGLTIPQLTETSTGTAHFESPDAKIQRSDLPLTFQHAMDVAQKIGVKYIWVDSLCIKQGSHQDWLYESSRMCSVFSNSYCTIAATASKDARGGLFRRRDPSSKPPCRIRTSWDRWINGTFQLYPTAEWEWEVVKGPLGKRAWVLQERLLSPRVLHFGGYQLYWECKQLQASETNPDGLLRSSLPEEIKSKFDMLRTVRDRSELYKLWREIVIIYSDCELTKESDKLVAISGIAENIHEALGGQDTYLAGLWKNDLPECLMWKVADPSDSCCPRPSRYRAPTWSWASLDVKVLWDVRPSGRQQEAPLVTILEASTNLERVSGLESPSPFGPVTEGMVRVQGLLFAANIRIERQCDELEISIYGAREDYGFWERELVNTESVSIDADEGLEQFGLERAEIHGLYCLVFDYEPGNRRTVRGLLLTKAYSNSDKFERFGTFEFWEEDTFYDSQDAFGDLEDTFCDLLEKRAFGSNIEMNFLEYCGNGEYAITLV